MIHFPMKFGCCDVSLHIYSTSDVGYVKRGMSKETFNG